MDRVTDLWPTVELEAENLSSKRLSLLVSWRITALTLPKATHNEIRFCKAAAIKLVFSVGSFAKQTRNNFRALAYSGIGILTISSLLGSSVGHSIPVNRFVVFNSTYPSRLFSKRD